jgi:hypothetical protein
VDEREAHMLNAFTTLELAPDGHVELNGIKRNPPPKNTINRD